MALRTPLTAQPHLYIGDSTGRPLDYGRVYFGEPNKDPEFYPIDIYLNPEMTIAAAQPVRTKGGFMDVGGNLAELHAAEVIYSLKVLDQYGRQVFYKPEMYRNNVSDFLVDEITRATAAETLIAGKLTTETQRAIAAEKVIADAVVTEKDRAVKAEGLIDAKAVALAAKDVELEGLIGSVSGGNVPYPTYDAMVAEKANITNKMILEVTNDTDQLKNGRYTYDGVSVFTKSAYDPLTQAKADATTKANTAKSEAITESIAQSTNNTKATVAEATRSLSQTSDTDLHQWVDATGVVGAGIDSQFGVYAEDFITPEGGIGKLTSLIGEQDIDDYIHVNLDASGNIVFGVKQDGSIVGGSSGGSGLAEMRAGLLNSVEMNEVGLALDAKLLAETPLNYGGEVAAWNADGGTGSRMPLVIKTDENELCVIYHQMGRADTDEANVALVQRFVTYNLHANTFSVSPMSVIIGNALTSADVYNGANVIELKNGSFMMLYGQNNLGQYKKISTDKCRTWSEPVFIAQNTELLHGVANGLVRINDGMYNNRIVLALWGTNAANSIGGSVGCIYSDDEGLTWTAGGVITDADFSFDVKAINEVSLVCDASNNLVFVIRNEGYGFGDALNKNTLAISKDGGKTLQQYGEARFDASSSAMSTVQCAPSIYNAVPKIILAQPTIGGFTRRKFRVRLSYDNLQTLVYDYAPYDDSLDVAYSSMTMLNNSTFVLVTEQGLQSQMSIKIKFLNLAEII